MNEHTRAILRNPEDYCNETLMLLGTVLLGININTDQNPGFLKDLGLFFIQKLKNQPAILSVETLQCIITVRRLDTTQRVGQSFVTGNHLSVESYREKINQEVDMLIAHNKTREIIYKAIKMAIEAKFLEDDLTERTEESAEIGLLKAIAKLNTLDKNLRNHQLRKSLAATKNPSVQMALSIILLCNELFHLDKPMRDKIVEIYSHCVDSEAYDRANLVALRLLYQEIYMPRVTDESKIYLEKTANNTGECSAAVQQEYLEYFNGSVKEPEELDEFLIELDAIITHIIDHDENLDEKLCIVQRLREVIIQSDVANKKALLEITDKMLDFDTYFEKSDNYSDILNSIQAAIKNLQQANENISSEIYQQLVCGAKVLLAQRQQILDGRIKHCDESALRFSQIQQAIALWKMEVMLFQIFAETGNLAINSREIFKKREALRIKGQTFYAELQQMISNLSATMMKIKILKTSCDSYRHLHHDPSDEIKNSIVESFVKDRFQECQENEDILQTEIKQFEQAKDSIEEAQNILQYLEARAYQTGVVITLHGIDFSKSKRSISAVTEDKASSVPVRNKK